MWWTSCNSTTTKIIFVAVLCLCLPLNALADCDLGCNWQKIIKVVEPLNPVKLEPVVMNGISLLFFVAGHTGPIEEGDPTTSPPRPSDQRPDTSQSNAPGQQSSSSLDWLTQKWAPYIDPYAGMDTWGAPSGPCLGHLCGDVEELGVPDAGTPDDYERLRNKQTNGLNDNGEFEAE
jgi:hypothetical protein